MAVEPLAGSHSGPGWYAGVRLGKKRRVDDPRTLKLTAYLPPSLPAAPTTLDVTNGITDWGMMANNRYGDCTCAAAGHMEMVWSRAAGTPATFTDEQILDLYGRVNGGQDDGAVEIFVLKEWRTNGLAGHRLHAFAGLDVKNLDHVRLAAYLFTGLYIGVELPVSFQQQAVWDASTGPNGTPGSWGGHAMNVVGYDSGGVTLVTWGRLQRMTWAAWLQYTEEAYAVIPDDYRVLPAAGVVDIDALNADLGAVTIPGFISP